MKYYVIVYRHRTDDELCLPHAHLRQAFRCIRRLASADSIMGRTFTIVEV